MASTGEVSRRDRRPHRIVAAAAAALFVLAAIATTGPATTARRPADAYLWFGDLDIAAAPNVVLVDGLPKVRYDNGLQTNPLTITQWGLEQHAKGHDTEALRAANWMVDHQQADGTWRYNFAYENASVGVDLGAGWISALTQGQALPLLVRAWKVTGDTAYLDAGRAALRPFERTVDKGGVLRFWNGHPLLRGVPDRPSHLRPQRLPVRHRGTARIRDRDRGPAGRTYVAGR